MRNRIKTSYIIKRILCILLAIIMFNFLYPINKKMAYADSIVYNLCWPVPTSSAAIGKYSSAFGPRTAPTAGASTNHRGIDIPVVKNTPVYSVADGVVELINSSNARGNYILVYHSSINLTTLYQHLNSTIVQKGATVKAGQQIAFSGDTGIGTGAHLHYGVITGHATKADHDQPSYDRAINPLGSNISYLAVGSLALTGSNNPDSYPVCERDLVYNSTIETGDDVRWVQCILKHLGYSIDIDGSYGPASRDTIKKFQSAYGLTVDGMCGPNTRAKLKSVWASKGHTWNSGTVVTAATHTTTGVKNHKCNYCEATKNETIAKIPGCTYGAWQNLNSTQHKHTCACGASETANHTWNGGVVTQQPTCTVAGVKTYTCTGCNATKTETVSAKGHSYGAWQNYNGTQHKRTCACGATETANHAWNSGTITKPATHTEEGIKTFTCTGCNATKTETIAKSGGHSFGTWQNVNSAQHKRTCVCGASETADHTWNNGAVTQQATCTEAGVKTYTCTGCNATKTDSIEVKGHSYGTWQNYSETQHKRTCACGNYELNNHDWDNGTVTVPATYTQEGLKTYECRYCNGIKTETIPMLVAPENAPQIVVGDYEVAAGGTVKVEVAINNNPGIASLILKVAYDNSLMTLTDVQYNTAMGGQTIIPADYSSPVTLYWINAFENMSEDVVFATLTFKVNENATSESIADIVVSYDANDIYNLNEENIEFVVQNGSVTVIDYVPGDINGDGIVNNKDVTRLMQFYAGWDVEINEAALDVNGDNVMNNKDVTRLMQFLAQWDVEIY